MKTCTTTLLALLLFCLICTLPAAAMPPHPDLLQKIRNHEIPEPYYLSHESEIRAQGVEAPTRCNVIDMLRRRTLDENINMIVILMDFSDHGAHAPAVTFDSLIFGTHTGTVRDFYDKASYGTLTLVTVNMPSALGWQRAPQTYAYYCNNQNGFGNYPRNAQRLAEDAVNLVDPLVDFSQYDNDGDGYVDALFIVHTGPGAERSGRGADIWSHKWQMQDPPQVDGVTASVYSMEPEYWDSYGDMTCGVYCHEMGHSVFGLPDLYDYDYDSEGLGTWSLMAGGSWNGPLGSSPAEPDAWCRIRMGFASATNVTGNMSNVALRSIESTPIIYRLWTDGQSGQEYYLVENRQRTSYDHALPASGLMIYHVDDNQYGNDNQWFPGHTDNGNYRVALEQADGMWNLEQNNNQGDSGDPYPGVVENHVFGNNTNPSSVTYGLADSHVSVRHISASADTMYASFFVNSSVNGNPVFVSIPDTSITAGATTCVPVNVETSLSGRNVTSFQFTVQFDPQYLTLVSPGYDRTGSILPAGWTVTPTTASGTITIAASGATALSGQGTLLCLQLSAAHSAPDNSASLLRFSSFTMNQGTPAVDTTNGRALIFASLIGVRPSVIDLGVARVGENIVYDAFVIRNHGSAPLVIDSVRVPGFVTSDFHGPQSVQPNNWYPVRLQFSPTQPQFFSDTVLVYSSSYDSPTRIPINGRGAIPALTASTESLNFDSVGVGQTADRTIILSDSGYWPTLITQMQFTGGSAFQIIPAPQWPDTVPARGNRTYTIRFSPSLGSYTDTLTISHDAGAPLRIALGGVGLGTGLPNNGSIPETFALRPNYPNPFNPSTSLTYDVPRSAWVNLTVYDVLGRAVDVPVSAQVQPGRYTITWSCDGCGTGIYFFVLSADGKKFTQKGMLLR